jgi:saccharopine dehydrogenase (NAD+, L-lysine-forming)
MPKHFLLLGGYGNSGRPIAELLLEQTDARLTIAGRNPEKAENFANILNRQFPGNRCLAKALDARDQPGLKSAFKEIDLVIVASSTASFVETVADAVLDAETDYFDIQLSHEKLRILRSFEKSIIESGSCFITDGGYHPGIPAAMVRYAAFKMESLEEAVVGAILNINWMEYDFSPETITEFAHELKMDTPLVFREGAWKKPKWGGMADTLRMDFGSPYGRRELFPMFLEEMRDLPAKIPSLRKTGFYIGGMDWFSNWISFPLGSIWYRMFPSSDPSWIPELLFWGMKNFSRPPFYTRIRLMGRGKMAGKSVDYAMELSHPDGYLFTAIPVVACLKQYLSGKIKKPGLYTQGGIVEPVQFFSDIREMGIDLTENFPEKHGSEQDPGPDAGIPVSGHNDQ